MPQPWLFNSLGIPQRTLTKFQIISKQLQTAKSSKWNLIYCAGAL